MRPPQYPRPRGARVFPLMLLFAAAASLSAAFPRVALAIDQSTTSGPVDVRLSLSPDTPVIGDTLTLKIEVSADADVEVLMPDFGDALDRFSIIDFAPRQSIDPAGRSLAVQTYRLDPPSSGPQVIPPILIEFVDRRSGQKPAPDGLDAYEILTERIPFEVASVMPEGSTLELRPPLGELQPIQAPESSHAIWLIAVALVLTLLAPFLWNAFATLRRKQKRRSAYEVATARMTTLLQQRRESAEELEQFYVGLSSIVRQYIEDRFEMRAPELTSEEFLTSIGQSPDFSPQHRSLLTQFLRQADLVKFARKEPTGDETRASIEIARRFLDETREDSDLEDSDLENSGREDGGRENGDTKQDSHSGSVSGMTSEDQPALTSPRSGGRQGE